MWVLLLLLSSASPGAGQREGLVINRRARQRIPQARRLSVDNPIHRTETYSHNDYEYSPRQRSEEYDYSPVRDRSESTALSLYSEYSTLESLSSDYSTTEYSDYSGSEHTRTRPAPRTRSRLPRRRGGDRHSETETGRETETVAAVSPRRQRTQFSRGRVVSASRELNRDERAGLQTSSSTPSPRSRSRSRSRLRPSASSATTESSYRTTESYRATESHRKDPRRHRSRLRERPKAGSSSRLRENEYSQGAREKEYSPSSSRRGSSSSSRLRPSSSEPSKAQRPPKKAAQSSSGPKVLFPKKNLFGTKPKLKDQSPPRGNSLDSSPRAEAKAARSFVRNRGYEDPGYGDINPTKPLTPRGEGGRNPPELQSGRQDDSGSGRVGGVITVTHQVASRTVFTVVEAGVTKSLFAEVLNPSLEVVPVSDLKSTEVNNQRVVYAHLQTNMPSFGVTEIEFEAIQPTRTYREEERSLVVGGIQTLVTETIPTTVYNVEKLTARVTETPSIGPGGLGLGGLTDPNQLGALLQNVLLSLLGGNLLNRGGGGPTLPGGVPQGPPRTQLVTHTRSFLTSVTSLETIVIPVNFRGSKIFQTVTDLKTELITATDYSVQTLLNYDNPTTPFLPLAPTLHRAARVVPVSPPPLNLPILHTVPPVLQTSILTQTQTVTSTLTSMTTSDIILTLGGREIRTQIVEPHTQVVTSTVLSTQSVLVAESQPRPTRTLRQLQLLQAILRLRS